MMNEMELPKGHKIVTRAAYKIPDKFHSIQAVYLTDRKWWQFWLPKTINIYCTVERKAENE